MRGLFHHTALPSPDHMAALTIGMVVTFEAEPGPPRGPVPPPSRACPRPAAHETPRRQLPDVRVRQTAAVSSGPLQATGVAAIALPTHHPQETT